MQYQWAGLPPLDGHLTGRYHMISYRPFWDTLKESGESTYTLIKYHNISSSTVDKLRKNKPITTTTLNDLRRILNCPVERVLEYVPSEEDQPL